MNFFQRHHSVLISGAALDLPDYLILLEVTWTISEGFIVGKKSLLTNMVQLYK